ncbi:MAG: ChrR family anti-sigma-E factor [Gammaproteobacteria bacterium]|nr:ChrR family anti-sigma-E factor [Gammaproteobacteria bacterium]MBT8151438.1 ChrR family anti-sigma-E factor [Gammaproteobacteria bacterium]NND38899.1 hypothetical protein [Pseudomonadales bacterium]NNM10781.1 hypothetical protein [Pseudomonadales bacterium]RZV49598.1 MAG: hypothetical protein EX270_12395 [Pseudomonadales bacterium]
MAQFHPNINWLVDYSSGTLTLANALCVSAHLEFCGSCRQRVAELNALGGSLMQKQAEGSAQGFGQHPPAAFASTPDDALLQGVFEKIDAQARAAATTATADNADPVVAPNTSSSPAEDASDALGLPTCVRKLVPGGFDSLQWRKLGSTLSVARLGAGDQAREVSLHRLRAGGGVPNHDHRGEEVTVVLKGSFSDQRGLYLPGDFMLMGEGDSHRPTASKDMDCLCLSSVEAPIRFTGPLSRLMNPFMSVQTGA